MVEHPQPSSRIAEPQPDELQPERPRWRGSPLLRRDLAILLVLAAASTVPMFHYAARARLEFDGWMHLLIAREVGAEMWRQIVQNTHPPLYYLLLKAITHIGTDPLIYRTVSIVAAAVCVVAIGVAAGRVSLTRAAPILTSLAFGFATSTIIIASEVRSYMLATMFLLLALPPYLTLVRPAGDVRSRVAFVVFSGLAFLTHYGVLLVLLALLAAPVITTVASPSSKRAWRMALPDRWRADVATLGPLILVVAVAYLGHLSRYPAPLSHLPDFYYSGDQSLPGYVVSSLARQIALFSPFALPQQPVARAIFIAIVVAIPAALLVLVRRQRGAATAAVLPITLIALTAMHLVGSILGRYPFGGALRHQFFIFPFALLTLFLLVDRLIARIGSRRWSRAAVGLVTATVLAAVVVEWKSLTPPREQLFEAEYALFRREIPPAEAVYLDGFNRFAFFGQFQDWRWAPEPDSPSPRVRVMRVSRNGHGFLALLDRERWNALPDEADLYREMRETMRRFDVSSLAIFQLDQPDMSMRRSIREPLAGETEAVVEAARAGGFRPRKIFRLERSLFAYLTLPATAAEASAASPPLVLHDDGAIVAQPNPIPVCDEDLGVATVHWTYPGRVVDIRLEAADGTLWATRAGSGSAVTGQWVHDGLTLYVQDRGADEPTSPSSTLDTLVLRHTRQSCR